MIYIDFEQLGTPNATPALLGALAVHDNAPADFTIYLLDPLLARAAVAKRACRVADLSTALSRILAHDGAIVTWSQHDLRIVQNASLPARLGRPFKARWVNALADVRRWKNRLYRDWRPPGAGCRPMVTR